VRLYPVAGAVQNAFSQQAQSPLVYANQSMEEDPCQSQMMMRDGEQVDDDQVNSHEFDKYLKYSNHISSQHEQPNLCVDSSSGPMDSNHNYHHQHDDHQQLYYHHQVQQHQLHLQQNINSQSVHGLNTGLLMTPAQADGYGVFIKSEPSSNIHHQNPYVVEAQQQHMYTQPTQPQHQPQAQNQLHLQQKPDEEFSVILADVRKTCYSS